MNNALLGHWYHISSSPCPVEVTALNDDETIIDFETYVGETESVTVEHWLEMAPLEIEDPSNWDGLRAASRSDVDNDELFAEYQIERLRA